MGLRGRRTEDVLDVGVQIVTGSDPAPTTRRDGSPLVNGVDTYRRFDGLTFTEHVWWAGNWEQLSTASASALEATVTAEVGIVAALEVPATAELSATVGFVAALTGSTA